ncbi:MAG: ATP-binding protein [Nitrososphaeria archaeon]
MNSSNNLHNANGIFLGTALNGNEFCLSLEFLPYHFAFYGVTGSGKTRLAMKLAIEAEKRGIKLLILDVEGEWRNIIPNLCEKTEYYEIEKNLKINPFDLNDIGLVKLLLKETIFKGIEVEYRDLSPQMNYVLNKCIEKSMSIPELIENVISYNEKNLPFKLINLDRTKTALLVRLDPFRSNPALKEIFYCTRSSLDLNRLDDRNLIFNLHPLEAKVAYTVELRLAYNTIAIAYLKQALARQTSDEVRHMFIADEAQMLAPRILRKLVVTDTWATTEFATRLRKRGECLVIISQSPTNIEDDIRKNSQNIFIFRLQDQEDVATACGLLGYGNSNAASEYLGQMISRLEQRHAIVKSPVSKEPFIIKAPEVVVKQISDEEIRKYLPKVEVELKELEEEFLESVREKPFMPMAERRKQLGWDKETYTEVVNKLIEKGVIEKVNVPIGKGRPLVLYQLKGKKPSIKHEYYVYRILNELTSKGLVCRAAKIGEAKPDIEVPSLKIAINIELGKSKVEENIKSALEKFEKVIVCSDNKSLLKKLKEENKDNRVLISEIWNIPSLISINAA